MNDSMNIDVDVMLQMLDDQAAQNARQSLVIGTLQKQIALRDEEIAELKKAKPTKRTAAKKKP